MVVPFLSGCQSAHPFLNNLVLRLFSHMRVGAFASSTLPGPLTLPIDTYSAHSHLERKIPRKLDHICSI